MQPQRLSETSQSTKILVQELKANGFSLAPGICVFIASVHTAALVLGFGCTYVGPFGVDVGGHRLADCTFFTWVFVDYAL